MLLVGEKKYDAYSRTDQRGYLEMRVTIINDIEIRCMRRVRDSKMRTKGSTGT
jgi:hypothetical protein